MRHVRVAIAGSGFGGLGTAIRLRQAGVEDFVVLEKADDVGGTWRDNSYPGCTCDVPSVLYSFSFAPNPEWTRSFSPQPEIWAYLRRCADRFGVSSRIRFGCEVLEATWDDEARHWRIETTGGTWTADVFVAATGPLCEPRIPELPGLAEFAGTVFHSARWRHDHDLTGRRVAVVGTGASAIQFVPRIAGRVERLTVFQRTPPWILPRRDRRLTGFERGLYRAFPPAQRAARGAVYWGRELLLLGFRHPPLARLPQRVAESYLRRSVADDRLRERVTPDYTIGCKRILVSSDYLPALADDRVSVVADQVTEVRPHAVVTGDGTEHPADTIIFGTGFHVADTPIGDRVRGRDGRTLAEHWGGSPRAHLGVMVNGFPNLFLLLGPNTGLGHTSVVIMIEAQVEYVLAALRHLDRTRAAALEPRRGAEESFAAEVDRRSEGTVWTSGGCRSWYLDETGRNSALWPGHTWAYRRRLRRFVPGEYVLTPPRRAGATATAEGARE